MTLPAGLAHRPVHRGTLPNGLSLVCAPLPHLHTTTVVFAVKAGSRYEEPRINGISHVLEHMMFRGAEAFPSAHALNVAVEELGGTLDAATHVDFTTYELTLPRESFAVGLPRFAEILRAPLFLDLDLEKRILREELLEDVDARGRDVDVDNLSRRLLFGAHGLGQTITGTIDGMMALTEQDLRDFLAAHYVAKNAVLAVAGDVDPDLFADLAARTFGFLAPGARAVPEPPPAKPPASRFAFVRDRSSQSDVRLSFPAYGEGHRDATALSLLTRVLDDGMGSRLHHRLRDELGMAYDSFAGIDPYEECGVFDLGASVEHAKVPTLVRELAALVDRLRHESVPEAELERTRRRAIWDLEASLDHAAGVADFYAVKTLFGLDETLATAAAKLSAVTSEDLLRVAKDVFRPEQAHVACVGHLLPKLENEVRTLVDTLGHAG